MKIQNLLAAVCLFAISQTSVFAERHDDAQFPVVYVRGLAMLQLEDRDNLRIALPDAAGHDATITFVMQDGKKSVVPFKGHGAIQVSDPGSSRAIVNVPEVVRMKELFSSALKPLLDRAPKTISIPWSGIRRVGTEKVTDARYTFVRKDTGEEVETFRPRKIAESIRIELTSSGALDFGASKASFGLQGVKAIWIEYLPRDMAGGNPFVEHFHHYLHYVQRPAGYAFDVEPRKINGSVGVAARIGNSFWVGGEALCFLVGVD
ncbi:MAG TPA: hypothetical protein VE422_12000 [Terriglobia bacterium]|nr:hypothetical protein [Terriglobia bacterium]